MKILEREIESITYAANQTATIRLPRNYAYRKLCLTLMASISRAAGATDGQAMDSAPAQLVKNIVIRANGRDVIKNYDMQALHRINQITHGTRPHISADGLKDFAIIAVDSEITASVSAFSDQADRYAARCGWSGYTRNDRYLGRARRHNGCDV